MFDAQQIKRDFKDPVKRQAMLDEAKLTIESFAPEQESEEADDPLEAFTADGEQRAREGN